LAGAIRTRLGQHITLKNIKTVLRTTLFQSWAGIAIHDGDTITAALRTSGAPDQRDKTWLRVRSFPRHTRATVTNTVSQYDALVDRREKDADAPEDLEERTFFGQLNYVLTFTIPPSRALGVDHDLHIAFAVIKTCKILPDPADLPLVMDCYKSIRGEDIVDIGTVQCVVGRVRSRGAYFIIDRTGTLNRAWYNEDE
jgi:hypothetical protein